MDIIYFKTSNSSFILTDQKILEGNFKVKTYFINNSNAINYVYALIKLFIFLILRGWQPRIYFIRFADWHSALLTVFKILYRKKLILVVGGFDAFHLPDYAYGVYHRPFRGWCAKYSLRNATLVLPNSPFLIEYTNSYASKVPIKGGIKHFVPDMKGKIRILHNGFDGDFWIKGTGVEKRNMVVTVAGVTSTRTFYLKGIDSYIELAARLPEYEFVMIGMQDKFIAGEGPHLNIPRNLKIIGFIPRLQLLKYYIEARVFCLFSLTEGMSNVLCEAMLCECVPVGSNVTFIPEIIGDCGFVVTHRDIEEMKNKVEAAMQSDPSMGKRARQRILDNYSLKTREKTLCNLINEELKTE